MRLKLAECTSGLDTGTRLAGILLGQCQCIGMFKHTNWYPYETIRFISQYAASAHAVLLYIYPVQRHSGENYIR